MKTTIDSIRGEQFTIAGTVVRGEATSTAAVLAGAGVIPVDSTAGYPAAGTLVANGVNVAYTALTATSFTGCTGTPALPAGSRVSYAVDVRGSAGASLEFTAVRARGAEPELIEKTVGQGITVPGASPGNAYQVSIVVADTSAFTKTELLTWELWLTEQSGDVTRIASGDWRVGLGAI